MSITVAEQLIDVLHETGVRRIYGLVGDSLNPIADAVRRHGSMQWIHVYNEEVTLSKNFDLKGDMKMRFVAQVGNILNRTTFCNPEQNFSSPAFGRVSTQCNQARSVQFGLRLDY